jgi:hypothetical protein
MVQPADVRRDRRDHVMEAFICIRLLPLLEVTALTIMPSAGS